MSVNERLTKLIEIAILAAVSYLLTFLAVPILPIAPYLKLDFGVLPILIGTVILGIGGGILTAGLSTLLRLIIAGFSPPELLGSFVWLVASITMLLIVNCLIDWLHRRPTWLRKIVLILTMVCGLTFTMVIANWLTIPLYFRLVGLTFHFSIAKLIWLTVVPFNLIKGLIISFAFLFLDHRFRRSKFY